MSVYFVAQLEYMDRAAYDRSQQRFMAVMRKFRGRLLAADEHPDVLEGRWPCNKIVVLGFPHRERFEEWSELPDDQEILKDRNAGARATVLLARGIEAD